MLRFIRRLQRDPYYLLFALLEHLATSTTNQCVLVVNTAHTQKRKDGNLTVKLFKRSAVLKTHYGTSNISTGLRMQRLAAFQKVPTFSQLTFRIYTQIFIAMCTIHSAELIFLELPASLLANTIRYVNAFVLHPGLGRDFPI